MDSQPSSSLPPSSSSFSPLKLAKTYVRRTSKAIMKSHRFHIPKYDLPVRLRPWFLAFTAIIMITLALLGFTNFSHSLPLDDKLLHFICFCIATGVFYFIFDVEEDARRIWFWRHAGLIFTGIVCFFVGGLLSEVVQSLLPYKRFEFGDVVANLLGSAIGLYIAYYLERYYRHRREISRLYQPLDAEYVESEDDDDTGVQLLPTHVSQSRSGKSSGKGDRLGNVWDEREELFGVGDDDSDEEADLRTSGGPPPRIVVSQS